MIFTNTKNKLLLFITTTFVIGLSLLSYREKNTVILLNLEANVIKRSFFLFFIF